MPYCVSEDELDLTRHDIVGGPYLNDCQNCGSSSSSGTSASSASSSFSSSSSDNVSSSSSSSGGGDGDYTEYTCTAGCEPTLAAVWPPVAPGHYETQAACVNGCGTSGVDGFYLGCPMYYVSSATYPEINGYYRAWGTMSNGTWTIFDGGPARWVKVVNGDAIRACPTCSASGPEIQANIGYGNGVSFTVNNMIIGYGNDFTNLASLSWGMGPDCGYSSGEGALCDPVDVVVTPVSCSGYICEYFCEDKVPE